ncbi:hypothetical protein BJP37_06060 [Moorena bouillonii PNG]|uniref:Uncharacterized protein n=1 Tax=Moorena bouillonii PNG TaxID=568701 RepID=A0A1U7MY99_9CYAN|nr:hypothetical protein BJP37_06060 [Moorena bouillonii PNG]
MIFRHSSIVDCWLKDEKNYGKLTQLRQGWGGSSLGDVVKGVDPPKSPLIRGTLPIEAGLGRIEPWGCC